MLISSQNALTETSRIMLDKISGYNGIANLTHNIYHHTRTGRAKITVSVLSKGRAREHLYLVLAIPGLGQLEKI